MVGAAEIPNLLPFSAWWLLLLIPLVVVIAVLGILIPSEAKGGKSRSTSSKNDEESRTPRAFVAKRFLVSERELEFFRELEPLAAEQGLRAFPQVRLEDVIEADKSVENSFGTRQTIRGMHLDFVLVERDTLRIRVGIELQDSTHGRRRRQDADRTKALAMEAAGVPLLIYRSTQELQRRGLQELS